jgi:hypothetical protein
MLGLLAMQAEIKSARNMRITLAAMILTLSVTVHACGKGPNSAQVQNEKLMNSRIIRSISEARTEISRADVTHGLELNIADELWRDQPGTKITGVNMALIGNALLERGLIPDGYEQKEGYRVYKYKPSNK